jgi:hypothetical protein
VGKRYIEREREKKPQREERENNIHKAITAHQTGVEVQHSY